MDVCESKHQRQKQRAPLIPEERNNAVTSRRPQTRDVSSRYRSSSPSPSTTSRYRSPSPSPSTTSTPRRSQSPTPTRTVRITSESTPKRAQSAERKRPSRPSSPPSPSFTPVKDSSIDMQTSSRKVLSGRLPEGLWPSTMRRLSVSFQSDSVSAPPSKKEKPVTSALSERPLRPSSNVRKQVEPPTTARKPTPEKKKSPPTGKNVFDQSENSKPVDRVPSRSMDQHRWPSKTGGKASSKSLARSLDLIDKMARSSIPPISGNKALSARRLSLDGVVKPLEKTATDAARISIDDRVKIGLHSIDDNHLRVSGPKKLVPEKSSDKVTSTIPAVRSQSLHIRPSSPSKTSVSASSVSKGVSPSQRTLTKGVSLTPASSSNPTRGISPTPARQSTHTRGRSPTPARQSTPSGGPSPTPSRQSTPSRGSSPTPAKQTTSIRGISPTPAKSTSIRGSSPTPTRHSTSTRGISPTPAIPSNPSRGTSPTPSRGTSPTPTRSSTSPRGISPSRIRPSNTSSQTSSSASVLSFIADFRNGKKSASYIEDAHQLRLVYNRYLQWRFANARADAVLHIKKVIAEKTLYNVWNDTLALCDTVILKRIGLQQLRLELKLNLLLNEQMAFLDDWVLLERDHASSLSGAVKDFEASTVRLPVTGGARVDIESLKLAVSSAVDVMQTMGSSICSLLPRVEMMNSFVSELAFVALQESDMLDQCDALLASTAAMQVEEYSLRTHLIQITQSSTSNNTE